jgi:hypothetical protein
VVGSVTTATSSDIWIGKFDDSLNLVNSLTINGSGNSFDSARDIFIDSNDRIYVVGDMTTSAPMIWLAKLNTSLVIESSTTVSGPLSAVGFALTMNSQGVYATGRISNGANSFTWVGKFNDNLVLQSTTTVDTTLSSYGMDITSDFQGNIYICGYKDPNIRIAKFDSNLVLLSSATAGGTQTSEGRAISFFDGYLYVAGYIEDDVEDNNGWIAKYDSSLNLLESAIFSNMGPDAIEDFYVDPVRNRLYFTGYYAISGQSTNMWVGECTRSFILLSSTTFNGTSSGGDTGYSILKDNQGRIFASGQIIQTVTERDIFVTKFFGSPIASSIDSIRVYPNPFQPRLGHPFITFENLPVNVSIKIYTLTGTETKELVTNDKGIVT